MQRKSLKIRFPTDEQVPNHLIRHFIRGYYDGDGSISISKDTAPKLTVTVTSSVFFCEYLMNLIKEKLNFNTKLKNYENPLTKTLVMCGSRQCLWFLDWLYSDCKVKLDRKYNKFIEFLTQCSNRVSLLRTGGSKLEIVPLVEKYV